MTKPKICFIGLTPLGMLPLMRYIIPLFDDRTIHVVSIHIENAYRFDDISTQHDVMVYEDVDAFNKHTISNKFRKLSGFISQILQSIVFRRISIFYTVDFQIAALLIGIKRRMKSNFHVVYHQFEAFEAQSESGLTKQLQLYLMKHAGDLSLAVFPESNRLTYFTRQMHTGIVETLLIPNTNNLPVIVTEKSKELLEGKQGKFVIAHVGKMGATHYTFSYLDFIRRNKQPDIQFLFIGAADPEVNLALHQLSITDKRVVVLGVIPHAELLHYYGYIDIGVILYKGIDINNEFCAPNKLYEYWSQGIPVIAHALTGLTSIWHSSFMGNLVNMEDPVDLQRGVDTLKLDLFTKQRKLRNWFEQEGNLNIYLHKLKEKVAAI